MDSRQASLNMADFSNSNVESIYGRDISADHDDEPVSIDARFIVVGQRCRKNVALQKALEYFGNPVEYSHTGLEYLAEAEDYDTIFVLDNFESDSFNNLRRARARIMGPAVIIKCADTGDHLPHNTRPLYCQMMQNLILCFTGFKVKGDLSRLADLVHHMGGSIRKDFNCRVTHLVANCTGGEKYRVAVSLGTPIMSEDWVHKAWEMRDHDILAADECLSKFRMSPFFFSTLSFLGFSKDEQRHMEELTVENGGTCAEPGAPTCTHLVVDEHSVKTIPFETHPSLHKVKSQWFWGSIQMDACADEAIYKFEEVADSSTPKSGRTTPGTVSGSKSRKRKRLRENLAQLAAEGDYDSPMYNSKRRSNEVARMSFSASFLDATADTSGTPCEHKDEAKSPSSAASKASARQLTVMELLQTEKNYVGILHTILHHFKEEIENEEQPGGPLLDPQDIKLIFGGIPPIYEVHTKIRDELAELVNHWTEDCSIGAIINSHAEALLRAYPPFVNFFMDTKDRIQLCDKSKPRFHAFLKVCQSKPECGRQTLTELLIRPVQRLPSIMLLLKDILKRTDKNVPDYEQLELATQTLENVMKHINEDKRRTEGHQAMFDIVNDIDNCPPNLLSAHRSFISRVDTVELTDTLSGKGDNLTLFLFSDRLEMCKRRVKVLNAKSPASSGARTPQKAFKHLEMLSLSSIKKVVDICETKDCKNVFALVTKELNKKEKLYAFMIIDDVIDKSEFLRTLSKNIATQTCRADFENLLISLDAEALNIDTSDLNHKTLSKAATKFGRRVSRAFSFNKTPRKLKRAMSSMSQVMSPFRRESMSFSSNSMTPRGHVDLRGKRLASVNDLTDETYYSDILEEHCSNYSPKKRRESLAILPNKIVQPQLMRRPKNMKRLSISMLSLKDASPIAAIPSTPTFATPTVKPRSHTVGHAASSKILGPPSCPQ